MTYQDEEERKSDNLDRIQVIFRRNEAAHARVALIRQPQKTESRISIEYQAEKFNRITVV